MKYYISDIITRLKPDTILYSYGVMFGNNKNAYGVSIDRSGISIIRTNVFFVIKNTKIWTEVPREECVAAIIKHLL